MTDCKIGNKCQKVKVTPIKNSRRILHLGWRHKRFGTVNYVNMGSTIGPTREVVLNGNTNYSLEELMDICKKDYINDANKFYFQHSEVKLGTCDGKIITSFETDDGNVSMWEYCKSLRTKNHVLKLNLYTTQTENKDSVLDGLSSCSSLLIDKRSFNIVTNSTSNVGSVFNQVDDKSDCLNKLMFEKKELQSDTNASITLNSVANTPQQHQTVLHQQTKLSQGESISNGTENKTSNISSTQVVTSCSLQSYIPSPAFSNISDKSESSIFVSPREVKFQKNLDIVSGSIQVVEESKIKFSTTVLGHGAQGVVTKGTFLGTIVAIKSIQRGKNDALIIKEIMHLEKIRHSNIINILAVSNSLTQTHIVMEYFPSNNLHDVLFDSSIRCKYDLTINNKNKVGQQISCALNFLHSQIHPIVHRDIKPGNILINHRFISKICDLGLAKSSLAPALESSVRDGLKGTYLFMSPEILLGKNQASPESDVWSFACTLTELYNENSVWKMGEYLNGWECAKENIFKKNVPKLNKIPEFLQITMQQCFSYDSSKRPTMQSISDCFQKACIAESVY